MALDQGQHNLVLATDIEVPFDRVWHKSRMLRVLVDGKALDPQVIQEGVLQGSVRLRTLESVSTGFTSSIPKAKGLDPFSILNT